ncbi:hypothetical protein T265_10558 [Opisthorchis viverrini]|uniref:Uncharacterized protein n=1 Tax=Opisthorchis viverrini TaxID=6198 RepID=A0A075A0U9_OPIVI|nr:hypothetical protein T265_10558 [Opisthorchis viverrini]KER21034.1 hypothetical protein T265_10558 [Opisthorchis viverrini]
MINTTEVSATSEVGLKPNQAKASTNWLGVILTQPKLVKAGFGSVHKNHPEHSGARLLYMRTIVPDKLEQDLLISKSVDQVRLLAGMFFYVRALGSLENTNNTAIKVYIKIKLPGAPGSREKCPPAYKRTTLLDNFLP